MVTDTEFHKISAALVAEIERVLPLPEGHPKRNPKIATYRALKTALGEDAADEIRAMTGLEGTRPVTTTAEEIENGGRIRAFEARS